MTEAAAQTSGAVNGAGQSQAAAAAAAAAANQGAGSQAAQGQNNGAGAATTRPENLPEQFWDSEKAAPKLDALLTDYHGLSAKVAEHTAARAAVPEKPDGYALELPKDFEAPQDFTPMLESPTFKPLADELRAFAHAAGLNQEQFSALTGLAAKRDLVEHKALTEALAKEAESLGSNGPARIDAVVRWLTARLPDGQAKSMINNRLFTKSMIEGWETIMRAFTTGGIPAPSGGGGPSQGNAPDVSKLGEIPSATARFAAAMAMSTKPKR